MLNIEISGVENAQQNLLKGSHLKVVVNLMGLQSVIIYFMTFIIPSMSVLMRFSLWKRALECVYVYLSFCHHSYIHCATECYYFIKKWWHVKRGIIISSLNTYTWIYMCLIKMSQHRKLLICCRRRRLHESHNQQFSQRKNLSAISSGFLKAKRAVGKQLYMLHKLYRWNFKMSEVIS